MKQSKKQKLKKELDRLAQRIFVSQNPKCLICCNSTREAHHYIQKNQSLYLRWDFRNYIPLCGGCHCKHHISGDPRIHQIILRRKGMKWADSLEIDRRIISKDTISNLLEVKERLENE